MFVLRSARGQAILAGIVLVLLLVGMAGLAVWRAREDDQKRNRLDHSASAATALEGAEAGFWWAQGALSALVISGDPAWVDDYDSAFAVAEQNLAKARAELLAMGEADKVSTLDDLTTLIGEFNERVRPMFPVIIQGDRQAIIELATTSMSELTAPNMAIVSDLEGMVREAQQAATTEREAANRAADVTLWLLLSLSGVALATGIGIVIMFVGSVIGPLAGLRASARAITSGSLEARARVSGPEEVASLAHDFNEMTDALATKTKALEENERRYRLITENTADVVWVQDMSLKYTYVSPSITRMRGYTVEEVVGLSIRDTMTPASLEAATKTLAEQLALEGVEGVDPNRATKIELEMYCKDGSTIWTEMNMTFMRDPDGKPIGILGITRNISERKRMEEERERLHAELEVRAITDGLTGLYNHAHFFQRLAEELDRCKRHNHGFAVVMMDVDNFKLFNDSRGHQAGDEMLRLVADGIQSALRRSDIAFRYGGDEFAAILPHTDSAKAQVVVNRINRHITKSLKQMDDGATANLALSAGLACFPDDGSTADALVKAADAVLYSAKSAAHARSVSESRELAVATTSKSD